MIRVHRDIVHYPDAEKTFFVLTGGSAPKALLEAVDAVTEMQLDKHTLQQGRTADRGVEW